MQCAVGQPNARVDYILRSGTLNLASLQLGGILQLPLAQIFYIEILYIIIIIYCIENLHVCIRILRYPLLLKPNIKNLPCHFFHFLINVHFVRIKKKKCMRLKRLFFYFAMLLTLKEPRGGLTALLLFYLLVSAYQILIVGLASALFPQLYYIPCPPKKRKKYSSQKNTIFSSFFHCKVCVYPCLARSFAKNML